MKYREINPPSDLADVAFDNGYADQSHFIRDFKEFSGVNPSACENPQMSFICQHREVTFVS